MAFGAGKLRKVIKIQSLTETQNTLGEPVKSWSDWSSSVRADVQPLSRNENFTGTQEVNEQRNLFRIRYRDGVEPKMRIVYKGISWNVESVTNVGERDRELELIALRIST